MKYATVYNNVLRYNREAADLSPFYTKLAQDSDTQNSRSHLAGLVDYTNDHDHPLTSLYQKMWEQKDNPITYHTANSVWHSGHSNLNFPTTEEQRNGDYGHKFKSGWVQHQFIPTTDGKVLAYMHVGDTSRDQPGSHIAAVIEPEEAAEHIKTLGQLGHSHYWTPNQFEGAGDAPNAMTGDREQVTPEEAVSRLHFNVREHGH